MTNARGQTMKNTWKSLKKYIVSTDHMMLLSAMMLSLLSCVMLYVIADNELLDTVDMSTFRTQLGATLLGIGCAVVLSLIDYNRVIRLWWLYMPIAIGLVLLTFTSLGYQRSGADDQAWLGIGSFYLQPSELLKLAFILSFSFHLAKDEENMNRLPHMLLLCLHACVPLGLVALQGDYGTAIIFGAIFVAEILSAKISIRYIFAALVILPIACWVAWNFLLDSVHKNRILILFNPGTDPQGLEYQQDLGLSALASGGVFGLGFQSENYVTVPEMHNDFIFSFIGQSIGLVGALFVVVLLAFLCLKILTNNLHCKNAQGRFICVGVFGMLLTHCFMNIGMVLKVMPVIGIPLPFLSAGGTAMVCMYIALGLVNSTRCHNVRKTRVFYDPEPDAD